MCCQPPSPNPPLADENLLVRKVPVNSVSGFINKNLRQKEIMVAYGQYEDSGCRQGTSEIRAMFNERT